MIEYITSNITSWIAAPILIVMLIKPINLIRTWVLIAMAWIVAHYWIRKDDDESKVIVIASHLWLWRKIKRGVFKRIDSSFMAESMRFVGPLLIVDKVRNESEKQWVAKSLKRQLQHYLACFHKSLVCRVFEWFGFTGAFREGFGQFVICEGSKRNGLISVTLSVVKPRRYINTGLIERWPLRAQSEGASFDSRLENAKTHLAEFSSSFLFDETDRETPDSQAMLILEAKIAAAYARNTGEAMRILLKLGNPEKSPESLLAQVPILLANCR